jgi:hypothetical protein
MGKPLEVSHLHLTFVDQINQVLVRIKEQISASQTNQQQALVTDKS